MKKLPISELIFKSCILLLFFLVVPLSINGQPNTDSLSIINRLNKARDIWYANPDSAYILITEAQEISKEKEYRQFLAKSYNYLGITYDIRDNYDSALANYSKALTWAETVNDTVSMAGAYNNIGLINWNLGKYDQAIKNYMRALRIFEQIGRKQGIANSLNNIGLIFWEQERFEQAERYFKDALQLRIELKDDYGTSAAYANIGLVMMERELDSAEYFLRKAVNLKEKINDKKGLAIVYNNLYYVFDQRGQEDSALSFLEKSIEIHHEIGDKRYLASNYSTLGFKYYNERKFDLAMESYIKGLEIAREINAVKEELNIIKLLARMERFLGNYRAASDYYYNSLKLQDSVYDIEKEKSVIDMQEKYEAEKREKELAENRASLAESKLKLSRRNTLLIGMGTIMLFIIILTVVIYRQEKFKRQRMQAEAQLKEEIANVELQNKLNEQKISISRDLHDNIGAQLTFISSTVDYLAYSLGSGNEKLKENMRQLSDYTHEAITQLRDTVWAMKKSEITGEELSNRIKQFIEKANHAANNIKFSFQPKLRSKAAFTTFEGINLYRMVQEAVNNALKHASPQTISVVMNEEAGGLEFVIRDDGSGFDKDQVMQQSGLSSLHSRAEEVSANLLINSNLGQGTTVTIRYPGT